MLTALSQINIELTSRCDKSTLCAFCGHQDNKINPNPKQDIPISLLADLAYQLQPGIVVQFHRDGEPTAYPFLGQALKLYKRFITSIVTHGENLVEKAEEIINNCTTLTVSAFKGDPDARRQLDILERFLEMKGDLSPMVNIKIVGDFTKEMEDMYGSLGIPVLRRSLHIPSGNSKYFRNTPMIPEHGICQDFLTHPSVDSSGQLHICNRLDVKDEGVLGDLNKSSLDELWNSDKRLAWLDAHKRGKRNAAAPLCTTCIFYGIPS